MVRFFMVIVAILICILQYIDLELPRSGKYLGVNTIYESRLADLHGQRLLLRKYTYLIKKL